jgi:hypothetical protein
LLLLVVVGFATPLFTRVHIAAGIVWWLQYVTGRWLLLQYVSGQLLLLLLLLMLLLQLMEHVLGGRVFTFVNVSEIQGFPIRVAIIEK